MASFIDALRDLANAAGKAVASASAALHAQGVAPPSPPSATGPTMMGQPVQPGYAGPGVTQPPPAPPPPWALPVQQPGQTPWALPAGPNQPQFDWQLLLKNLGGKLEGAQKFSKETGTGDLASSVLGKDTTARMARMANLVPTAAKAMEGDPTAIVKLATEAIKMSLDAAAETRALMKAAGGEAAAGIKSERAGETAGHFMRAAGDTAAAMPPARLANLLTFGLFDKITGPMREIPIFLVTAVDKLRDFAQGLHEANMKFAEFSGSMAAVQAQQEVRDIMLSMERGERRAASAGELAASKTRLERAVTPWEDRWANIKNFVTSVIVDKLAAIVERLEILIKINPIAAAILEKLDEPPEESIAEELERFEKEEQDAWDRNFGRPERFGNH